MLCPTQPCWWLKLFPWASGVAGGGANVLIGAIFGDAFEVAAFTKGFHRVFGQIVGFAPFADCGTDVLPECAAQGFFGVDQRAVLLMLGQVERDRLARRERRAPAR